MLKKISQTIGVALTAIISLGFAAAAVSADVQKADTQKTDNTALQASIVSAGVFKGLSNHVTTGGVSIINTGNGHIVVLENNFSLDGAPAPTLGFGKNGKFDTTTEFTKLSSITGAQVYQIPASINPADFTEFYIWCADFSVPLGVATLK